MKIQKKILAKKYPKYLWLLFKLRTYNNIIYNIVYIIYKNLKEI